MQLSQVNHTPRLTWPAMRNTCRSHDVARCSRIVYGYALASVGGTIEAVATGGGGGTGDPAFLVPLVLGLALGA